jgi:hypothetical protein
MTCFPFMVGQNHDRFTLLSVKDVMSFQQCQPAIQELCKGYRQDYRRHSEANLYQRHIFVSMSERQGKKG